MGGGPDMSEVWKHLAGATQQSNGLEDHKPSLNGASGHGAMFGSLAGLYGMDPAAAYTMMPGM